MYFNNLVRTKRLEYMLTFLVGIICFFLIAIFSSINNCDHVHSFRRNILRKMTKMVSDSNEQQRRASASIFCEDPFSSSTPYAEELEFNIDFLIDHQDIRQCHFPGDQNRAEDRYEEEAYNPNEEGQHVFQSLSPD